MKFYFDLWSQQIRLKLKRNSEQKYFLLSKLQGKALIEFFHNIIFEVSKHLFAAIAHKKGTWAITHIGKEALPNADTPYKDLFMSQLVK